MFSVVDKLSLQGVLRQLLCGSVFFASICVLLPLDAARIIRFFHNEGSENLLLFSLSILSLTIGTLIYHIEKNFYSYFVQIWLNRGCYVKFFHEIVWLAAIIGSLSVSAVLFSYLFYLCHPTDTIAVSVYVVGVLMLIMTLLHIFLLPSVIDSIVESSREQWLAENCADSENDRQVIMQRVANWSDFIHCGQCCAFAWILGSFCVLCYCLRYDPSNVPYVRMTLGLLCSLLLLSLELIADWHRYHHVLYILNTADKTTSPASSISNPQD